MKIIQVISSLGNGGAEKMVVELSNEISALDHHVILCSFKDVEPGMAFPALLSPDVSLITCHKKPGFSPGLYGKLFRLFRKEKPDVVHLHLDATLKYILPLVSFFPKTKFVYTIHSDLNAEKKLIFRQLQKLNFLAKKVRMVCISSCIQKEFEKAFPFFNYTVVENGIADIKATQQAASVQQEIEAIRKKEYAFVLTAVGKLDKNKNHELMISALNEIACSNVLLLILGQDFSADNFYVNKLTALKKENVFLLGPKDNVVDYLRCSDAFIMSSLNEGLPISALEAFAAGLPVLTSPAGGLMQLVQDAENGFVAKDFSIEEMACVLQRFLKLTTDQRKVIGQRNRNLYLSKYTIGRCAAKYLSIYNC